MKNQETPNPFINLIESCKALWNSPDLVNIAAIGTLIFFLVSRVDFFFKTYFELPDFAWRAISSLFCIPWLGYMIQVIAYTEEEVGAPPFHLSLRYFQDGVLAFFIIFCYSLLPLVPLGLAFSAVPAEADWRTGALAAIGIVGVLLAVTSVILATIAICRFAISDELGQAFNLKDIRQEYKNHKPKARNLILVLVGLSIMVFPPLFYPTFRRKLLMAHLLVKSTVVPAWILICAIALGRNPHLFIEWEPDEDEDPQA